MLISILIIICLIYVVFNLIEIVVCLKQIKKDVETNLNVIIELIDSNLL